MRTLPVGRGDAERMPKQPVPQPLRLTGLCLLVAAMGVLQRSLPAVLVAGFGRARHYRGNGGPNRAVLLGVSQEPENRRRHRQVALPHSAGLTSASRRANKPWLPYSRLISRAPGSRRADDQPALVCGRARVAIVKPAGHDRRPVTGRLRQAREKADPYAALICGCLTDLVAPFHRDSPSRHGAADGESGTSGPSPGPQRPLPERPDPAAAAARPPLAGSRPPFRLDLGTVSVTVYQHDGLITNLLDEQHPGIPRMPPATGDDQLLGQLVHKFQCARAGRVSLRPRHGFPALPVGISNAPSLSCNSQAISAQVPYGSPTSIPAAVRLSAASAAHGE